MARTSAKAKKSKQEVIKKKEEAKQEDNETPTNNESGGDSTDKENDSVNYDVEKITHTRIFKGKRQYLVRWKGYSEDGDTWENESALQNCKEILETFKKEHLGDVNSDDEAEEEKEKPKSKTKTAKKKAKKSGKSSKPKEEVEDNTEEDDIDLKLEEEEEVIKPKKKKSGKISEKSSKVKEEVENDTEEDEVDLNSIKNKQSKGKKRSAAKETESSKAKIPKKTESDDESVTDGKDYEVDRIIEVHTKRDGSREFLIRWKGYKPSEDTWEPEAHLDCQELIEKFMEKVEKAKELTKKDLRENRTQTKRFIAVNRSGKRGQRTSGLRPCYTESMYDD